MTSNDIINELGTNFIEYAVAVNTDRSIPDAKSGLKPVAKRILWSAYEEGRTANKPHVKAARIVGDVMGKYHPHGDSSIYGAMVRLSQPWVMRYPLIDWHGNNGNIAGDGPAAARYTEARLSKISEDGLLYNIKKKNVDFIPNYDETLEEPVTLPAVFPNLLCNPNTGIGVAMACNWAPHNLKEVSIAILDYLAGKEPMLPGPDFPTGGIIINKEDIPSIMKTGRGSVKIRARYKVEKQNLIFYEVPYGQTIEGLLSELGEICDKKEIEGITDAHDESNKKGIRIVITCAAGIDPNLIANKIYLKTSFQTSFSYNQVALINKTPTELNLKDCCKIYVDHNIECLIKESNYDLRQAENRKEIVEGLLKALEDIDNIIALIKKSESSSAAKENLIKKYDFTENQAKAILAMRLSSLAKLEQIELNKEEVDLINKINTLKALLSSEKLQINEIAIRLQDFVKKYGDERKTDLAQIEIVKEEKEEIPPEDVVVVINQNGNIKRFAKSSLKIQHKTNKGIKTAEESILTTISTNTADTLMLFSNKGQMYRLGVDKIPAGTGINIQNIITMLPNEKIVAVTSLFKETNAEYVVFFTKNGLIKKTLMSEYKNTKKTTGIQAIKLKEDDGIASVTFLKDEDVIIITEKGMSIHIETKSISPIGRITLGRKAVKLNEDDKVLIGIPINQKNEKKFLITCSKKGLCNKSEIEAFSLQNIGGKGVKVMKLSDDDNILSANICTDDDGILIITDKHSKAIPVNEITNTPRDSCGRVLVKDEIIKHFIKL